MTQGWHRREWALVAAIAILMALALLLVPHGNSGDAGAWLAVLPILLFFGVISPLSLLSPMAFMYLGRTPDAPALPASFQRPPPIQLG
jgi:ABC-type transport system involved in cytochrome bd biosynthesis fused ATPase/permease subunit